MLQPSTLKFLKDLKKNNNKEWFDANRKRYEAAKADFAAFVQGVIDRFCKTDATLSALSAKDCLFRINRDIRFSKDKSPYKTNFGASINAGGKKRVRAGYYLHLEPGQSFVGGGIYMPTPEELKKVRQEIDYNFEEFRKLITNKKFKTIYKDISKDGELSLSRPPKGYDENNPAIEYIKLKSVIAMTPLNDADLTDKKLSAKVVSAFEALYPVIVFINKALEN
ncbi:MAG TPA: DUF2461 domain-containing protein [Parafilimonas sp.]|nr:DUF2461 domain-containing protein [Parafilimonas sp.]